MGKSELLKYRIHLSPRRYHYFSDIIRFDDSGIYQICHFWTDSDRNSRRFESSRFHGFHFLVSFVCLHQNSVHLGSCHRAQLTGIGRGIGHALQLIMEKIYHFQIGDACRFQVRVRDTYRRVFMREKNFLGIRISGMFRDSSLLFERKEKQPEFWKQCDGRM